MRHILLSGPRKTASTLVSHHPAFALKDEIPAMPTSRFLLTTTILFALLLVCLASGCNSVRDAWNTRGMPPQSEPDITETGETL